MAENLNELNIALTLDTSGFDSAMERVEQLSGLDRLIGYFSEMSGLIENSLSPVIDDVSESIAEFFISLDEAGSILPEIIGGVIALVEVIIPLGLAVVSVTKAFGAIGAAFGVVTGSVGIIIAAIVALALAFNHLYQNNDEFATKINTIWFKLKEIFTLVVEHINNLWSAHGDKIMSVVQYAWGMVEGYIMSALDMIIGMLDVFIAVLNGDWQGAWNGLKEVASTSLNGLVSIWGSTLNIIWGAMKNFFAFVWEEIDEKKDWIIEKIGGFTNVRSKFLVVEI